MRILPITILILFAFLRMNSQERITDFANGSQKANEIGHECNDGKYIISFLPGGEVEICQLKDRFTQLMNKNKYSN